MPRPRTVYECVFCKNRFDSEDGCVVHESRCTRNPQVRGCHTCTLGPHPNERDWRCSIKRKASTTKRCEEWRKKA